MQDTQSELHKQAVVRDTTSRWCIVICLRITRHLPTSVTHEMCLSTIWVQLLERHGERRRLHATARTIFSQVGTYFNWVSTKSDTEGEWCWHCDSALWQNPADNDVNEMHAHRIMHTEVVVQKTLRNGVLWVLIVPLMLSVLALPASGLGSRLHRHTPILVHKVSAGWIFVAHYVKKNCDLTVKGKQRKSMKMRHGNVTALLSISWWVLSDLVLN